MAKKDSFVLYTEQKAVIDKLSDEQAGKLVKAIYEYVETGEMPELDNVLDLVITPFKTILDKDRAKYEEVSKARAEAGSKGGKTKENKSKQKKQLQTKENKDSNCDDNENDNDNENENDNDNDLLLKEQEEKLQIRFIECLNSYNTNAISECLDYLKNLSFEVIDKVLSKTSGLQHPNWNYAKTILDDYVERKIDTLEKLQEENSNNEQGEVTKLEGVWEEDE